MRMSLRLCWWLGDEMNEKSKSFEERRAEEIAEGRVHLPESALVGMSERQAEFYLSLRGRYRFDLARRFEEHCKRITEAYGVKQPVVMKVMMDGSVEAARKLMAMWDRVPWRMVLETKIDSVGGVVLAGMTGAKEALEELR